MRFLSFILLFGVMVIGGSSRKDEPCARQPKMKADFFLKGKKVHTGRFEDRIYFGGLNRVDTFHDGKKKFNTDSISITAY